MIKNWIRAAGLLFVLWVMCQVLGYMGNHGMIGPAPVSVPAGTASQIANGG